jgi:elongator complex protein 1
VFGLSSKGSFYAADQLIASNCTSFVATTAHLIFTTSNHLLKFVHLSEDKGLYSLECSIILSDIGFDVPKDEPEKDERCRTIERGAKLVTVIPSAYSLVLQMPRGNLETIYPRALVLASIRKSVDEKHYLSAFLSCRSQRVDMNILYDHNPTQFIDSVDAFVKQLAKVEYIDLFLSQLRYEL